MLANFWPGCVELTCVTEGLEQTIFICLFVYFLLYLTSLSRLIRLHVNK